MSNECVEGISQLDHAFFFSVQTAATIGANAYSLFRIISDFCFKTVLKGLTRFAVPNVLGLKGSCRGCACAIVLLCAGYGGQLTPDPDCWKINALITFQTICSLMLDYTMLGLVYARCVGLLNACSSVYPSAANHMLCLCYFLPQAYISHQRSSAHLE